LSRLDENNGSLAIKLTSDDLREIDSAASKITVQGDRYPEHLLRMSVGDRPSMMTTPSVLSGGSTSELSTGSYPASMADSSCEVGCRK